MTRDLRERQAAKRVRTVEVRGSRRKGVGPELYPRGKGISGFTATRAMVISRAGM